MSWVLPLYPSMINKPVECKDGEYTEFPLECPDCYIKRGVYSSKLSSYFCVDCGYFEGSLSEWLIWNNLPDKYRRQGIQWWSARYE